ncbi:hypothetical protein [Paenibacillus alkalitolerans]|uniref:hypothetical protein n=1 Tax=Paenibacillus alkalitolerans TaxID=2799335 RepID=UPI0018F3AB37|nr:hypothetical protein [Paenibacillus alkalitolerans]
MSEAISKAKLLEYTHTQLKHIDQEIPKATEMQKRHLAGQHSILVDITHRIESGTFDLLPTDVEIGIFFCGNCGHEQRTNVTYQEKPSEPCKRCGFENDWIFEPTGTDVDVKEVEEALNKFVSVDIVHRQIAWYGKYTIESERWIRQLLTKLAEKEAEVERLAKEREQLVCLLPSEVRQWETLLNQAVEVLEKIEHSSTDVWAIRYANEVRQSIKGAGPDETIPGR